MPHTPPSHYLPGKAVILSRLPAQDWFTPDEAAEHSGWSRSFIRTRVISGDLPAQTYPAPVPAGSGTRARHLTAKIHVDDLVLFILRNSNGKYTDEKVFRDVATVIRTWPAWMRREMVKHLERSLTPSSSPEAGGHDNGAVDQAQTSGRVAAAPGGAVAAHS